MEVSQRRMILSDLPSDLLDDILRFRDVSHQVIELWKCGDRMLNAKLASGLTYIHLEGEKNFPSPTPSVLFHLRALRYLYLESQGEEPEGWIEELSKLPSSLEELHLLNPNSLSFLDLWSNGSQHASHHDSSEDCSSVITPFSQFSKLHTLRLTVRQGLTPITFSAPARAWLPSSLTRLVMDEIYVDDDQPLLASYLPRTLLRLETKILGGFTSFDTMRPFLDEWAHAPPQLEYISEISLDVPIGDYDWLPKTLIGGRFWPFSDVSLTPTVTATVPPLLDSLAIFSIRHDLFEGIGTQWSRELPKNLKSLALNFTNYYFGPDAKEVLQICKQIMHFPKSLTSFTASGTHAMNWEAYNANPFENLVWPPFLTHIDLSIPLEHLKLLPRTLVTLKARLEHKWGKRIYVIDANVFSAQLTTLALSASLDERYLMIENQLPLLLTDLSITSTSSNYAGLSHKSFHQLAKLDRLRTLEICLEYHHETSTRKNNMLELPPNLTSLSVAIWNPRWFPSIPRSVTSLNVSHALHGIDDAFSLGHGVFYGLPPDLVTLKVNRRPRKGIISLDAISASNFPLLPKLRHLCIHEVGEFDSRVLRALNGRLKTLKIALKSVDKDDAPFFPPDINSLVLLISGAYDDALAEHWPVRVDLASGEMVAPNSAFRLRVTERRSSYLEQRLQACSKYKASSLPPLSPCKM